MNKAVSIVIVGVGGQGILTFSEILGKASLKEGKNSIMSEVHGMAQRGGVVISEMKIGKAEGALAGKGCADYLVGFEPVETYRAIEKASDKTWILISTHPIVPFIVSIRKAEYPSIDQVLGNLRKASERIVALDSFDLAKKAGGLVTTNSVMLGALAALPGFPVKKENILDVIKEKFSNRSLEINEKAFNLGFDEVSSQITGGIK